MHSPALHHPARARTAAGNSAAGSASQLPTGLTGFGLLLFGICLFLAGSGVERFRDVLTSIVGSRSVGMSVHPYLIPVAIVFPLVVLQRITIVPRSFIAAFAVFSSLTYISTFYGGIDVQELIKVSATFLTIVTTALLVRTREDFLAGVMGMCVAVGILSIIGIVSDRGMGEGVIAGTGRNTFSLYTLPMMLLGGYVLTRFNRPSALVTITILAATTLSIIGMILTLNRSGWLGAGVIGLLLFRGGKFRGLLIIIAVLAAVVLFFRDPVEVQVVRDRVAEATTGNRSDALRRDLLRESLEITVESPLLGVSPQELPKELARRLGEPAMGISPHNVVAHIMAGSGIPCLFAFFYIGFLLWQWQLGPKVSRPIAKRFLDARSLLRMMVALWLIRGMFSHEILYAPAFSMGLGLCIGMCLRYSSVESLKSSGEGRKSPPETGRRRRRLRISPGLEM